MSPQKKYQSISLVAATLAVFLAIPSIWPYGFYQLVRWVVCLSAGYNVYVLGAKNKYSWATVFIFIAILFNPIAPIHFGKDLWQVIDFTVGVVIIVGYFKIRKES